ncbi:unnamed protein product [Ambrosiozyma monospora]|uniref:Unnamed protein product n=1 Tax=Ambrosiozyma monospora TaxID=43982 RepID=A0ACB5TIQ6_AMBMO|nr:unnamed protein product [Ambrosiozyma monospora]
MQWILEKLVEGLPKVLGHYTPVDLPTSPQAYKSLVVKPSEPITQSFLWNRVSTFFKPTDIAISETGTSAFGIIQAHFPGQVIGISQVLFGSIGYATGAAAGASFAASELNPTKRVILFTGEGSFQLTTQSVSDCCRWKLNPYLFVLNNNGYTIEKLIHGPKKEYNNIQPWNFSKVLELFATNHKYENIKVSTQGELDDLLNDAEFNEDDRIRLIEVMIGEFDAPQNLIEQARISEKINE